jgi:hypothetical protein
VAINIVVCFAEDCSGCQWGGVSEEDAGLFSV